MMILWDVCLYGGKPNHKMIQERQDSVVFYYIFMFISTSFISAQSMAAGMTGTILWW